ncbi:hypothetical protein YK56LOC_68230 [Caballeronia sp. HLA56]
MADITFNCPRLNATVRRHIGPQARKMSATSSIGSDRACVTRYAGAPAGDDFVQQVGGDLDVKCRGLKLLVAQQH